MSRPELVFSTSGKWSAADLVGLLLAVENISISLLTFYIRDYYISRETEKDLDGDKIKNNAQHFIDGFKQKNIYDYIVSMEPDSILGEIYQLVNTEALVEIKSINMKSPGSIRLNILGGLVEQLRELIKDLWYRNKQERLMGEIKILEQIEELNRKHCKNHIYRYDINGSKQVVKNTVKSLDRISQLKDGGKLDGVS